MARRGILFAILALNLALGGCNSGAKRRTTAQPPVAALAPQVLPLEKPKLPKPIAAPRAPSGQAGQLISQAEALYADGMDAYQAGNLDKARAKFDQALSLLLESKLEVVSDPRLSAEFDKLVEDIHSVEVAAVERGDTLSVHKYEPAPIESFADLTFPVDPKVKERVQQEMRSVHSDLPLISNDLVDGVITYFQGRGRAFIENVLKRKGKYQKIISEALRKEGMPQELIYLAAGESAFNPFAVSRARAVGIWQFVLGTAELYGLKKDRWVDEREDPVRSTQAAVQHLKDLYQTFGDWYLAMAAYDSGPLTVQRAVEKTGYADFWKLRELHALPRETENYVPIFMAIALIAKDPKSFGFDVDPESPPEPDKVVVNVPTDLRLVAELIDRPVEELIQLNPSLLRWTSPANDPDFVLNLPAGTGQTFEKAVGSIPPDKRVWWRTHKVVEGETLSSIASKYRLSALSLARANQVDRETPLEEGTRLVLPLAVGSDASLVRVRERSYRRLVHYRVRSGDTLDLIADRFDVTPYQLRRWNHLKSSRLVAGKMLAVYVAGGGRGRSRARRARGRSLTSRSLKARGKKEASFGPSASAKPASRSSRNTPAPIARLAD